MPADDFVAMASDPHVIGNPRLRTQHLVGATRWVKTSDTEVIGYHQMRVAHQKYGDDNMSNVVATANAHGKGTVWYRKIDGVWKFAGIEPDIRWSVGDHNKIFEEGEKVFNEEKN
jgi:scytalone dehydratase